MTKPQLGRPKGIRRAAVIAALTVLALLATDFEATAHRHGGTWAATTESAAIAASTAADAGWPCAICRLADNPSRTAPDPVCVAAAPVVSGDPVAVVTRPVASRLKPVRSPRAPPASLSC